MAMMMMTHGRIGTELEIDTNFALTQSLSCPRMHWVGLVKCLLFECSLFDSHKSWRIVRWNVCVLIEKVFVRGCDTLESWCLSVRLWRWITLCLYTLVNKFVCILGSWFPPLVLTVERFGLRLHRHRGSKFDIHTSQLLLDHLSNGSCLILPRVKGVYHRGGESPYILSQLKYLSAQDTCTTLQLWDQILEIIMMSRNYRHNGT
mmetsp:Transcript_3528/g.13496  ORF Transcript_3528/g.13496 Transcript_3528/m.13496 type:complete len:204 (+) Transcript_3528:320-931(+)